MTRLSGNLSSWRSDPSVLQAAYDALNRLTKIINPVGGSATLEYDSQGQPITQTDEDGRVSRMEYDIFQRLAKQTDGLGNGVEYDYTIPDGTGGGTLGSLYAPTEARYPSFTRQARFDTRERPTSQSLKHSNSLGEEAITTSAGYDKRGQMLSETDALGKSRSHRYDALGQRIETTDRLGNKTKATYDAMGNLIQLTDANGNTHKFEYDRNGRMTKETLPLGQATSYSYDAAGNLATRLDPNGNKTAYSFDAANRLSEVKEYKSGNVLSRTTTYSFDANDNLTGWSDTDHSRGQTTTASATYDDANRKTGETVTYPAGNPLSYGYQYSAAGKKTQLTWPDGTAIGYGYNAIGELESVGIPGEGSISVNQFKWSAPTKITLPGGNTQERTFDGLLNLEGLKVKTAGQQTVLSLANTFKAQNLKASSRTDTAGNFSSTKSASYIYDDETRLTQAATDTGGLFGSDTETFTLDAVGNRTGHSKVSGAWTHDADNRLLQQGNAASYEYDEAGNLTKKTAGSTVTRYSYDTRNRLTEVKDGLGNLIARYGYDPMNRRAWKEQYRDRDGNPLAQAKRTCYFYADEGLIAEASQDITLNADQSVTASGSAQIISQYGPRPNAAFTTGMLFIKTKDSNGQDVFAYYHHDHLGTPVQATDKQGNVVWAASYEPFGKATITTPAATAEKPTISSNLRLPGQMEDAETGLYYNWHRYYDPATGRYVAKDPIGFRGRDVNLYRYAKGNPLKWIDPTGLFGDGRRRSTECKPAPNDPLGHSDFDYGDVFDFTKEDHGWTGPFVPGSTERHFRPREKSEGDVQGAIDRGNLDDFERAMHQGQDSFSHWDKGYRWDPGTEDKDVPCNGWGHACKDEKDNPDNDPKDWGGANKWTKDQVDKWKEKWGCLPPKKNRPPCGVGD